MNRDLKLGLPETAGEFKVDARVQAALTNAREKIENKAKHQCSILRSNLGLILREFCDTHAIHAITSIGWVSPVDQIAPCEVLDMLAARLTEQLTEQINAAFLERFTTELIELDANERRSQ
jgi:hypothetical protein